MITYIPQLIVLRYDEERGDHVVRCPFPSCGHAGLLMRDFSLLAAGFNGIEAGDPDDVNLQECGGCARRLKWDHVTEPEPEVLALCD